MKNLADKLFQDRKIRDTLTNAFKCLQPKASKATARAVCNVASRQQLNRVLKYRRACAAELLGTIRSVKTVEISYKDDFGDTRHTVSTEPYFYDSAYQLVKRQQALPVDKQGKCVVAEITIVEKNKHKENKKASSSEGKPAASNNSNASNKKSKDKKNTMEIWPCTSECKAVTESEVQSIVSLRQSFDKTIDQLRQDLYTCDDGCPNTHFEKFSHYNPDENQFVFCAIAGHPLVCSNDSNCQSKLRILRAVATHYPKLVTFMHQLYIGIRCLKVLEEIDKVLWTGDLEYLISVSGVEGQLGKLFSKEVDVVYEMPVDDVDEMQDVESSLLLTHAQLIADYDKVLDDHAEHVCCSCERLYQRKSVSRVKLSDNLGTMVWPTLKAYIEVLYMCTYCKPLIKKDKLPSRCVLNGLIVPVPPELSKLDVLSIQLIQRAKCYQTVVRLGTHGKSTHVQFPKSMQGYNVLSSPTIEQNARHPGRGKTFRHC